MKDRDEEVRPEEEKEDYSQPLLTKHDQLRTLTGKSGEKDGDECDCDCDHRRRKRRRKG